MISPHKSQWRGALIFSLIYAWLNEQSRDWWFETPLRSLWRHCNNIHVFLQEINVRPAFLKVVDPEAFCGLHNSQALVVNNNQLSTPPLIEPIKVTLQKLSLNHNIISELSNDYFKGCSQLRIIRLAGNKLTCLPSLLWIEKSIEDIYTSENRIESLDTALGDGFYDALSFIDVGYNIISYLNVSLLRNYPQLERLLIFENRLASISDYRAHLSFETLVMYSNPWHYDSELAWMSGLVSSRQKCDSPGCFAGELVTDISENYWIVWIIAVEKCFGNTNTRMHIKKRFNEWKSKNLIELFVYNFDIQFSHWQR